jgi:hypothetical protein
MTLTMPVLFVLLLEVLELEARWKPGHLAKRKWHRWHRSVIVVIGLSCTARPVHSIHAVHAAIIVSMWLFLATTVLTRRLGAASAALIGGNPATHGYFSSVHVASQAGKQVELIPLEETPAPISMSGSSTTIFSSIGIPPVPPYSAVRSHLRSASVKRSMGMMLTPV